MCLSIIDICIQNCLIYNIKSTVEWKLVISILEIRVIVRWKLFKKYYFLTIASVLSLEKYRFLAFGCITCRPYHSFLDKLPKLWTN